MWPRLPWRYARLLDRVRAHDERLSFKDVSTQTREIKRMISELDRLMITDNCFCIDWTFITFHQQAHLRYVIPASLRTTRGPTILQHYHDSLLAGHIGLRCTHDQLKTSPFYWPGQSSSVCQYVGRCHGCARKMPPQQRRQTPMGRLGDSPPTERLLMNMVH